MFADEPAGLSLKVAILSNESACFSGAFSLITLPRIGFLIGVQDFLGVYTFLCLKRKYYFPFCFLNVSNRVIKSNCFFDWLKSTRPNFTLAEASMHLTDF